MKNPWRKINTKVSYNNLPWWTVRRDKVINPNGKEDRYDYIYYAKDFICVIPLEGNLNTYLVRQWRYPIKENSWEFSMGGIENGETPL